MSQDPCTEPVSLGALSTSPAPNSSATLAGLPTQVRARIFRLARLVRKRPIGFSEGYELRKNHHLRRAYRPWTHYDPKHTHVPLPVALLRVNRQFYNEASKIFYGENSFFISCPQPVSPDSSWSEGSEAPVLPQNLSPRAYAHLRELRIYVADHKDSETSWQELAISLKAKLNPWTTHLAIFCNQWCDKGGFGLCIRSDCTRIYIEELASGWELLKLRSFSICFLSSPCRLSYCHDIAKRLARCAPRTWTENSTKSFAFAKLPFELRRQVLKHTGLVQVREHLTMGGVPMHNRSLYNKLDRICCKTCKPAFDGHAYHCACNWRHAYSTNCSCQAVPRQLFKVSRQMRREALDVYYSEQHIVISGYELTDVWEAFSRMEPDLAQRLRQVKLVFKPRINSRGFFRAPMFEPIPLPRKTKDSVVRGLFQVLSEKCNTARLRVEFCLVVRTMAEYGELGRIDKARFPKYHSALNGVCAAIKRNFRNEDSKIVIPRQAVVLERIPKYERERTDEEEDYPFDQDEVVEEHRESMERERLVKPLKSNPDSKRALRVHLDISR